MEGSLATSLKALGSLKLTYKRNNGQELSESIRAFAVLPRLRLGPAGDSENQQWPFGLVTLSVPFKDLSHFCGKFICLQSLLARH